GAERRFLAAYRSGRVPHAWLIGGEPGIGKGTLAYRIARFVLAYPDPSRMPARTSLALDPAHPTVRRVAVNAHPDLLVLERTIGDTGKMRTVITVEQVRRLAAFFGSTAGEGGWRICIVDSADELKYPEGSNALLKMLEEPPPRSLFLLVSHAPGRLLPTIRSRCRRLVLRPLGQGDVVKAASIALGVDADDPALAAAAAAARGSVSRAIALAGGPMLVLREKVEELLNALPSTDPHALHALGDQLDRDRGLLEVFVGAVRDWLSAQLDMEARNLGRLARMADLWERLNRSARDVEIYNLERKPFVFTIFGLLAEASRG
ncbi:MAG TPA: DNA polymerase III subunit delta', partial [Xanthobacteraceae bacterium]|nr:DNA polymerase III subunit delta' [Xanthobacteraceae bacterium]